ADHTTVWTGTEMIVWGGYLSLGGQIYNSGGRYDPVRDQWSPTSMGANLPSAREYHTAVWTGSEMIIWGGYNFGLLPTTGGRYDPARDSWTPTSTETTAPLISAPAAAGPSALSIPERFPASGEREIAFS